MASSKEYLKFVLDQLSSLDDISYKAMMGEFIISLVESVMGSGHPVGPPKHIFRGNI